MKTHIKKITKELKHQTTSQITSSETTIPKKFYKKDSALSNQSVNHLVPKRVIDAQWATKNMNLFMILESLFKKI